MVLKWSHGSQISATPNRTNTALCGGMSLQQHWDFECIQLERESFDIKRVKQQLSTHALMTWTFRLNHPGKRVNNSTVWFLIRPQSLINIEVLQLYQSGFPETDGNLIPCHNNTVSEFYDCSWVKLSNEITYYISFQIKCQVDQLLAQCSIIWPLRVTELETVASSITDSANHSFIHPCVHPSINREKEKKPLILP